MCIVLWEDSLDLKFRDGNEQLSCLLVVEPLVVETLAAILSLFYEYIILILQFHTLNTSDTLTPPNPNAFFIAVLMDFLVGSLTNWSSLIIGVTKLSVPGTIYSLSAMTVNMDSIAPAAPNVWPS